MESLTQRQETILKGVVESHIETTGPVGSRYITQRYELPLSSATIRNEMGALEEMGFLTHPHTSSGRIPTDTGYRYYLDHTVFEENLPAPVCDRVSEELAPKGHNFDITEIFLDRLSSMLSSMTQEVGLSLAMPPHQEIVQKLDELRLSLQGLTNMLEKPEFHDVNKLRALLKTLEEKIALKELLLKKINEQKVSVSIGREHQNDALEDCAIVTARYSVGGKATGVVAILGPKRMPYRQVVPLVSRVATLMSDFFEFEKE
jgi:transcriptional regulator of heat shock response